MSKSISVEIKGVDELKKAFAKAPQVFVRVFDAVIRKAIYELQSEARKEAPVDMGFLRGTGMQTSFTPLVGKLENASPYAFYVHEGTKPHWPPMAAIKPWADRHGIPAFVVARSIAKKGTKANPFFDRAIEKAQPKIDEFFEDGLTKFNDSI